MFEDIGNTIKSIAKFLCITGIIGSIVSGIVLCTAGEEEAIGGIITIIGGSIASWVSSAFLYGFGQLIDNSDKLVKKLAPEYAENEEEKCEKTVEYAKNKEEKCEKTVEYVHKNWEDMIKKLDISELIDRSESDDYDDVYRKMCIEELNKRQNRL